MKVLIKADGEKAWLPRKPTSPSMKELRIQIEIELGQHIRSYCEVDRFIRDEQQLFEIDCLLKIREFLRSGGRLRANGRSLSARNRLVGARCSGTAGDTTAKGSRV